MPFNIEKYRTTEYERRTEPVPVPALAAFFDDDEKPVIVVQNLTGPEVYRAEQRVAVNKNLEGLVKKLADGKGAEAIEAALEALGLGGSSVPDALAKAIAYVQFGCASVKLEQSDAVRLAEFHIDSFLKLFNAINRLTSLGHVPLGESNASGPPLGCRTPSPCAPEADSEGTDFSSK
ncbi:hypothetical protein DSCW_17820 [Desulfosarcina widdelii]|uniref:Uncharacterized protein n=1 Tax=Desulfosarcina widdelii TaxID=947919 RepID=A0A5K7Z0Z3_9BACT|nr:hypothetical protein [Desulfosarcina widdelii]BBO74365.1 hypothetical protein DSCW_17820 [Desulfosarcina widdelii]